MGKAASDYANPGSTVASLWRSVKLRDICILDKQQGIHTNLPYIGLEDIESGAGRFLGSLEPRTVRSSTFHFTERHVLYGRLRPYLNKTLAPNFEGHCSTEIFPLMPKTGVNRTFLQYWLMQQKVVDLLNQTCTGARMPRANMEAALSFSLRVPSVLEQERIVALLDQAFEGIGTALANTEKSRGSVSQLAHAGGFPSEPIIGKKCYTLADLCEFIVDCEHKTAPIQEEGIASIRTPNIGKGTLLLDGVNRVSEETYRLWTRRAEPREGDLIFAREAPAGNVAVVPPDTRLCLGQRTVLLRPKRPIVDPSFLAQLILHPATQQKWLGHSRGATVQHVNLKDIRALSIGKLPSLQDQAALVKKTNALRDEINNADSVYEQKLNVLGSLKQSLMNQAFSGNL